MKGGVDRDVAVDLVDYLHGLADRVRRNAPPGPDNRDESKRRMDALEIDPDIVSPPKGKP